MTDKKTFTIAIYTSSITGNTRRVMEAATRDITRYGEVRRYNTVDFLKDDSNFVEADLHIIGFWCRRASLDDASISLLERLKDQKVLLLGTLGNYPDSPYGERVRKNVLEIACRQNEIVGFFLCQGKIEEGRTERRRSLPEDHIHYLNDRGYQRHLDSRSHPNERDFKNAAEYVERIMSSFYE